MKPDPKPQAPNVNQPMTFREIVDFAMIHYPKIGANELAVEVARNAARVARSERIPVLAFGGGYNLYDRPNILFGATRTGNMSDTRFGDNFFRYNATMLLPLYTGGRITNQIELEDLGAEAAGHRLRQTKDDLILNLANAYYGILAWQEVIRARERSVEALEEARRRVETFVKAGTAPPLDLYRVETRLANIRQDLVVARNALEVSYAILSTLMGVEVTQRVIPAEKLSYAPVTLDVKASIDEALRRCPELRRLEREVEIQERRLEIARAALKPQVLLELNYFGVTAFDDKRPGPQFTGRVRATEALSDWRAGINVIFPVFNRSLNNRVQQERAALERAKKELEQAKLDVALEVETAYLNIIEAENRIRATEVALNSAREALRVEQLKLNVGKGVVNDVLDAQADLLRAEENYTRAQADFRIFQVALKKAIGEVTVQ